MLIGGLQKTTLIDFPGKVACIVFTVGCNFRCGYCHNPELIKVDNNTKFINENEFFEFLIRRKGKLEGVVITGGEPTLQKDLESFIKKVKSLGFAIKLDTQGSLPNVIENLLSKKLIDYIAMDIKAPLGKYELVSNSPINIESIKKSIKLIMESGIDYEFRTTIVKELLSYEDIKNIGKLIKGAKKYYLQSFNPVKTLDMSYVNKQVYKMYELESLRHKLEDSVIFCGIR